MARTRFLACHRVTVDKSPYTQNPRFKVNECNRLITSTDFSFWFARYSGVARDAAPTNPGKALSIRYEFSGFVQERRLSGLANLIAKPDTHPFCPCLPNQVTPCGVEELLGPFHGR